MNWSMPLRQSPNLAALALSVALAWPTSAAPVGAASADEVKAAYLYRFTGYVKWPDAAFSSSDSPIVIGVVGANSLVLDLVNVTKGKFVDGRPIVIKKLAPGDTLNGLHVIFIARDAPPLPPTWLQRAREVSALLVTDNAQGLGTGAALNFISVDNRVRFEASPAAAAQANLKLSARLLSVAERVEPPQ